MKKNDNSQNRKKLFANEDTHRECVCKTYKQLIHPLLVFFFFSDCFASFICSLPKQPSF